MENELNIKEHKLSKYCKFILFLLCAIVFLNVISFWTEFSDFYRSYIYKPVSVFISRITSWGDVAIGEICMYVGMLMVVVSIIFVFLLLVLKREHSFKKFIRKYFKTELGILLAIVLIYTLMWIIPLRASRITFEDEKKGYSLAEVESVRNYILEQMELYAALVPRNENEKIIYDFDLDYETKKAVDKLAEEYPLFDGYQPPFKEAICSDFLEWMGIGGYTYPFTMEITCNKYVTNFSYPVLYSHELAHHNGYYRENEAEFFGMLAMIISDNPVLKYSGYYNAYYWIDQAYFQNMVKKYGLEISMDLYWKQPQVSDLIRRDEVRNMEEFEMQYNEEVNSVLENVAKKHAEDVAEIGWDVQADMLGEDNYDGVVKLLLDYFGEKIIKNKKN